MNKNIGTIAMGIKCPIIRQGDDLEKIVFDSVVESQNGIICDNDVIGITESVVARAQGNYVTIDEVANEIKTLSKNSEYIVLENPIYSRNRFSMILKAFARSTKHIFAIMPDYDEVGNPVGTNPFTGVNIVEYYEEICDNEGCMFHAFTDYDSFRDFITPERLGKCWFVYCGLHDYDEYTSGSYTNLTQICNTKCEYGLLGSNKASEEMLKLFPNKEKAQELVENIKNRFMTYYGKNVEVMVYGDGGFKSPHCKGVSIWEFADPVVSPAYTVGLEGTPNEVKVKNLADEKFADLKGKELEEAIKNEIKANKQKSLVGNMVSQGTTPRRYTDLLGSLMDLCTGSGGKGTPIVLVRNYFNDYSND